MATRIRSLAIPLAAATLLAVAPRQAAGQDPPVVTETVVVTATLVEEQPRDVPASVYVVDAAEVDARQAESISELLATVPGAQTAPLGASGQQTSIFLRGANSNQTLVLWNGIPLNDPFSNAFNAAFLSTEGIERLEVVPGPFSALYGSNAMGGVVQVITATRSGARADLEAGSHDHRRLALSAGGALRRQPLHASVTGHYRQGGGGTGNDDYEGKELAGHLRWTPSLSAEAALLVRWSDAETGIPFSSGLVSPQRTIAWEEREWGLPWSRGGRRWKLAGTLSQIHYDNALRDPDDPFGFADTESRADRARAVASRQLPGWGWVAGGGDWERTRADFVGSFDTRVDGAHQRTAAGFVQAHLERGRWVVDLGVRRDSNDRYGAATSPRLGVALAAGDDLRLRASYGEAFRAPALLDLYFPFGGNLELEPERGRTAEVGLAWQRGPWALDLAAFRTRQTDLISFDPVTFLSVNIGRAESRGVTGELRWARPRFEARLGGMRLRAENRVTGRPLRNRPEETAHLVAIARPGAAVLSLVGTWRGTSVNLHPTDFVDADNPGAFTLDLGGSWQLRRVAPYARMENALDRQYEPVLGFPAPGRTLIGGVRVKW